MHACIVNTVTPVGITFPIELLERIDKERGEIPRTKYVLRILEKHYEMPKERQRR